MSVLGIDEITFAASDWPRCKHFLHDWGLRLVSESAQELVHETLNGCRVIVADAQTAGLPPGIEPDPTVREIVWGVETAADLDSLAEAMHGQPGFVRTTERVGCTDPNGVAIRAQVTRKREVAPECAKTNTWSERQRIDVPSPAYDHAQPIDVGHVVFFVTDLEAVSRFYEQVWGFVVSDRYPGRGHFLRCAPRGGHHDLFLLQTPQPRRGLNHVAFTVRDVHEVFGGGLHLSRSGWETELGPGRHPISSAIFWYFKSPLGGLWEYFTDEDELTEAWQPRSFTPGPTAFAEWAIAGGIDGYTRRQHQAHAPSSSFMTEKPKP
jgi:catechol 2,3-dioxygenase-like lactoylglutathione lyase family enzyme